MPKTALECGVTNPKWKGRDGRCQGASSPKAASPGFVPSNATARGAATNDINAPPIKLDDVIETGGDAVHEAGKTWIQLHERATHGEVLWPHRPGLRALARSGR